MNKKKITDVYGETCMFRAKDSGGRTVHGYLVIEHVVSTDRPGNIAMIPHIIQVGMRDGTHQYWDWIVDPDTLEMHLGQTSEYGRGLYVPMRDVLEVGAIGVPAEYTTPRTNSDRLRTMSDEALAQWLDHATETGKVYRDPQCTCAFSCGECIQNPKCILKWLRMSAQDACGDSKEG